MDNCDLLADNCDHSDYQTCKNSQCKIYKSSPWVCVARFFPDTYPKKVPGDKLHIQKYGPLTGDLGNCPRDHIESALKLVGKKEAKRTCAVHNLIRQQATVCRCNIFVTGCTCGVFKKEQGK